MWPDNQKILRERNDRSCSYFNFQAEEQLRIVEEQRKIHEERMKLEQERQRQQKEEQKIILGKGKSRPKLSFSLKTQDWTANSELFTKKNEKNFVL